VLLSVLSVAGVVVAAVLLIVIGTASPATPQPVRPLVAWDPPAIEIVLHPGATALVPATAMMAPGTPNADLWLTPSLATYVSVTPDAITVSQEGGTENLDVLFSVPQDTEPGTIEGALHLLSGKRTVARPLPITLDIWRLSSLSGHGTDLAFVSPPNWDITIVDSVVFLDDPALSSPIVPDCELADPPCRANDPPSITIHILENPTSLPLMEFVGAQFEGWFLGYHETLALTVDGTEAVVFSDVEAERPSLPMLAAFVDSGDSIVLITAHLADTENIFWQVLHSLQLE
jgi:hypothetical protein